MKKIIKGNFRPLYTMNIPKYYENIWHINNVDKNIEVAKTILEKNNIKVFIIEEQTGRRAASLLGIPEVFLNKSHRFWYDPRKVSLETRKSGKMSTSDPLGTIYHEIAHAKDRYNLSLLRMLKNPQEILEWENLSDQKIARRVSKYSSNSPIEFVAEVYAALKTGRKFDYQVMRLYKKKSGQNH